MFKRRLAKLGEVEKELAESKGKSFNRIRKDSFLSFLRSERHRGMATKKLIIDRTMLLPIE